jgi:hypothetical protein
MKNFSLFQEEAHCWTRRYEQLRGQVVADGEPIATDCRGLTVLITQGLLAWMRDWHEPLPFPAAAALEAQSRPIIAQESWQKEATRLLVSMAFSHLKPRPCNS